MADISVRSPGDALDPMIRRFVDTVCAAFTAQVGVTTPSHAEARAIAELVRRPWREGGPAMDRVEEHHLPTAGHPVRVRLYHPPPPAGEDNLGACLVYLHGGGWTTFSLDTHDRLMREYASRSGLIVAGVDYALSPEAKFPTALNQVTDVVAWLSREGGALGVDPARLVVGGDSAGGNLALAACLRLRDRGEGDRVRGMLLNYGVFQRALSDSAIHRFGGPAFMLSAEEMAGFWTNYLAKPDDAANPLASPILADLTGLPPAFLAIAECDILAEQNLAMARRLRDAGVPVTSVVYAGASHSFLEAMSIAPLSDRALDEASAWLRRLAEMTGSNGEAQPVCD